MTESVSILIVEDEAPIREGLADRLRRDGYVVRTADSLASARQAVAAGPSDLVLLDRRLPDGDGLEVLRHLRNVDASSAVIVLSARGETIDRIEGLEGGADDYVTKPFHVRELVARIHAVLARSRIAPAPRALEFGSFVLDPAARVLRKGSTEISLTRLEFDLLRYLVQNPRRAVERHELLDQVWGYDRFPTTRTVDYHVLSLRRKIESSDEKPRHIVTVHGVGYRFEP